MREICTSGSMRGEAATMVTLVPPLLLYCAIFSNARFGFKAGPPVLRSYFAIVLQKSLNSLGFAVFVFW